MSSHSPLVRWLCLVPLALAALVWCLHLGVVLSLNYPLEFGEGTYLQIAWYQHQGMPLYPELTQTPYWLCPYTPIYLTLSSLFQGAAPHYASGRLLSWLSILVCLLLPLRRGRWFAALFAGLFLVNPLIFNMSGWFRSDCLALVFAFAGLMVAEERPLAAALCCLLSILTKQSLLAAPLAIGLTYLIWDRKKLVYFAPALGGALGLCALLTQWGTGGLFWKVQYAFVLNFPPPRIDQIQYYLSTFVPTEMLMLPAVVLGFRRNRLWATYLLIDIFWLGGCGRPGGYYNYLAEIHLAICYLAALGVHDHPRGVWLVPLQMLTLGSWMTLPPNVYSLRNYLRFETIPLLQGRWPGYVERNRSESQRLGAALERHPGPVLAENLGKTLVHGRPSLFCDLFMYGMLFKLKTLDENLLRDWIRARGPAVIVLQRRFGEGNIRLSEEILQDIEENYQVEERIEQEWIMVARPKDASS